MSKQKTIGINPLTAYLTKPDIIDEIDNKGNNNLKLDTQVCKEIKSRITLHISHDLIERIKNAVFWQPGLTLASFSQNALEKAIDETEKERGGPFPTRKLPLKIGRPIK